MEHTGIAFASRLSASRARQPPLQRKGRAERRLSPLRVPHALALLEGADLLCVADRENRRVVCPAAGLRVGDPPPGDPLAAALVHPPDLGRRCRDVVYAVNGPTSRQIPVRGFTLDPQAEEVLDRWGPVPGFASPHALAVCPSGRALYVAELDPPRVLKFDLRPPLRVRRSTRA
ncbi:Peptidyl-alpha-hydroxyglycine alpha-amidating lyase 2 [Gryllus bimaculatus]|nr:Peptidyl-alpha-hydroxyglycine alpha-amidating lyase 2 [Gryllus bimaculatus]